MKKLLITSAFILTAFVSCAQDFTNKNMKTVERMASQYNLRIDSKAKLTGMQQQGFNLNYSDWCYHWVLSNNEKVIELAFHPSTGVVFLQTTSMRKYIRR
jgi:hypothetical protein